MHVEKTFVSRLRRFIGNHHLLESIDGHHHRHSEVLCVLYLLPHVAAALLQQFKVLQEGIRTHTCYQSSTWKNSNSQKICLVKCLVSFNTQTCATCNTLNTGLTK